MKYADRKAQREKIPINLRDTLSPCRACNKMGWRRLPSGVKLECPWCLGKGHTDKEQVKMFDRWLSLRNANRKCNKLV